MSEFRDPPPPPLRCPHCNREITPTGLITATHPYPPPPGEGDLERAAALIDEARRKLTDPTEGATQ